MTRTATLSKDLGHLLTSEVSELLRVPKDTLLRWRREGVGPRFIKIGRRTVRYPIAGLAKWLTAKQQGGALTPCKFLRNCSRRARLELKSV